MSEFELDDMSKPNIFVFDGREYILARAEIVGVLPDPYWCDTYNKGLGKSFSWSISFETIPEEIDDDNISPQVDFDNLGIVNVLDWQDLVGTSVAWSEPIDSQTNQRYGMTYLYDH